VVGGLLLGSDSEPSVIGVKIVSHASLQLPRAFR
jgi:hypothetical protein